MPKPPKSTAKSKASSRKRVGIAAGAAIGSAAIAAAVLFASRKPAASVDGVEPALSRWRLRGQDKGGSDTAGRKDED